MGHCEHQHVHIEKMTIKECEEGYHLLSSCHVCPFLLVKLLGYEKKHFEK
jgi:hypothetical protein